MELNSNRIKVIEFLVGLLPAIVSLPYAVIVVISGISFDIIYLMGLGGILGTTGIFMMIFSDRYKILEGSSIRRLFIAASLISGCLSVLVLLSFVSIATLFSFDSLIYLGPLIVGVWQLHLLLNYRQHLTNRSS